MKPKHVVLLVVGCVAAAVIAAIVTWNIMASNAKHKADQEEMDWAVAADAARAAGTSSASQPDATDVPTWSDSVVMSWARGDSSGMTVGDSRYPAGRWVIENPTSSCAWEVYHSGSETPAKTSSNTAPNPLLDAGDTLKSSGCGTWELQAG